MPHKYTWSARDKSGQRVVREVEARSAAEAQETLLADGYSELELKEDELMTAFRAGYSRKIRATAKQRVHRLENPSGTTWEIVKLRLNKGKIVFLLLIVVSSYLYYCRDFLVGGLMTFAFVFLLTSHLSVDLPLICYRRISLASDWNRWREVLALVQALKIFGKIRLTQVPDTELMRFRAMAFVGIGNLQKGIEEFQKSEGSPDRPAWLYKLLLAGFYSNAKQHDKAIELCLASISENPNATAWYDLANRYARYKRDAVKAREALTEAEKGPALAHLKPYQARCRGIIANLEGDYSAAKRDLESAIHLLEQIKWRPGKDGHLAIARAYLCCVLATQGDMEMAKKNLNLARKYLVATDEDELLAECRRLTGSD